MLSVLQLKLGLKLSTNTRPHITELHIKASERKTYSLNKNTMTLYHFKSLNEMEQLEVYWEGVYVRTVFKDGKEFEYKQIDDFYVVYRIEDGKFYRDMQCHKNTVPK